MKVTYAFRRGMYYPYTGADFMVPSKDVRPGWLKKIRELGFEGIEVGLDAPYPELSEASARELRRELEDAGVPCACVRGGGGLTNPRTMRVNRQRMEEAVRLAAWLGAGVANTGVGPGLSDPRGRGSAPVGEPASQGSSRLASAEDFERTAAGLREVGAIAEDLGVDVAIEVHQHSLVDNSWSALHLLSLIDRKNVGVNPDLGNIYWTYDVPEESCEAAITALAPHAKYWHCKNMYRVHVPQLESAIFLRVPLPDGEIDYRFALTAMYRANYQGCIAIEGVRFGDQLTADGTSAAYVRRILRELEEGGA